MSEIWTYSFWDTSTAWDFSILFPTLLQFSKNINHQPKFKWIFFWIFFWDYLGSYPTETPLQIKNFVGFLNRIIQIWVHHMTQPKVVHLLTPMCLPQKNFIFASNNHHPFMNFLYSFLLLLVVLSAYSESPQHAKPPDFPDPICSNCSFAQLGYFSPCAVSEWGFITNLPYIKLSCLIMRCLKLSCPRIGCLKLSCLKMRCLKLFCLRNIVNLFLPFIITCSRGCKKLHLCCWTFLQNCLESWYMLERNWFGHWELLWSPFNILWECILGHCLRIKHLLLSLSVW